MTELLTAAQMRAIEKAAIDSGEVTGLELMERAGQGVVEAIFEEWPELAKTDHRAVVLCGPGNNGGDGFVVARLLKERGWEVEVFLYGDAGKLPVDAKVNYERWEELGEVRPIENETFRSSAIDPRVIFGDPLPNIVVDALLGSGLSRPFFDLPELCSAVETCAMASPVESDWPKVISVDVPSGLDADSGSYIGYRYPETEKPEDQCIHANLTVTFEFLFVGHYLRPGPEACGKVVTKPIGVMSLDHDWSQTHVLDRIFSIRLDKDFTGPRRHNERHKYTHGHALILSGGVGKGGAARLAARGALRIGAGVVTVGCPPGALQENAAALDAIMVRALKGADGLAEALEDKRINTLCLGPGLGVERAAEMLGVALGEGGQIAHPTVVDADGLTALAGDEGLFAALHGNCVLTPHAGEFARLFPDIAEKLNAPATKGPAYSKVDATREAAARAGCVVLFKGADTVIADPSGRCSINSAHYERSAPWLATAGSGDVLAGFITGLLARGFAPMQAAETGAWLHVECALKFGPGLIAEDLPEQLPAVFRDLGV